MITCPLFQPLTTKIVRRFFQRSMQLRPVMSPAPRRLPPEGALGLYLHIPFCESLCPFCAFHRVKYEENVARDYFKALRNEILELHRAGFRFDTVYVGGGTPTVVPEALADILEMVAALFSIKAMSVETNPDHLRAEVLNVLLDAGIDRLSVGVQTFDDPMLKAMNRYDRYGSGEEIIARLRHVLGRFETLNVDMIFNLPGQTETMILSDLRRLRDDLCVDQISYYPLMTAQSTMTSMQHSLGAVTFDREKYLYEVIRRELEDGYQSTTIWNFSHGAGEIDEYIVQQPEYVGAGSGAFSYLDGRLMANSFSISRYIERIEREGVAIEARRQLKIVERDRYELLMGLFGLEIEIFKKDGAHRTELARKVWREIGLLRALGLASISEGRLSLTSSGRYFLVVLMREFFIGVNDLRDQMRKAASLQLEEQPFVLDHPDIHMEAAKG